MPLTQTASLTLSQMLVLARQLLADQDPVNVVYTDQYLTNEFNSIYASWYESKNQRLVGLAGTNTFGAIVGQTTPGISGVSTPTSTVLEFVKCFYETIAGNIASGDELENASLSTILFLQQSKPTQAACKLYTVVKASTTVPSTIGRWNIFLWPMPPNNTYISALARIVPFNFDYNTQTDRPDCSEAESRYIVYGSCARIAERYGRMNQMIQSMWSSIPNEYQDIIRNKENEEKRPT